MASTSTSPRDGDLAGNHRAGSTGSDCQGETPNSRMKRNEVRGQLTYAGTVRPGDSIWRDDTLIEVVKVRRAQGRKPPTGENLHLVDADGDVVKLNSTAPVRVTRATTQQ